MSFANKTPKFEILALISIFFPFRHRKISFFEQGLSLHETSENKTCRD
jgi:hypothetical protein